MNITPRKKQILNFITSYDRQHGFAPTHEEIGKHFRLAISTINQHLQELGLGGHLNKEKNQPRGIAVAKNIPMVSIPLLGTIAAGEPIHVFAEERESIAVAKNKLPRNSEVYALRVKGESMIDEGVNDGDTILVKKQATAENGQKVVALIDNNEATLKTFYKERGYVRLQPANKNYEPIIVKNRDLQLQGVLFDVIKSGTVTIPSRISLTPGIKPINQEKKLPFNKIICGDILTEIKKLPNESIDTIIADPPYNIGKDFGNNQDDRELNDYISWSREWVDECIKKLKPSGTMFIYGFSEILAHLSVQIPLQKRWLIWHYTNKNVASVNFWQRSHEAIICAWKERPIFNRDEVREPYTEGFLNGAAGKIRTGTVGRFSKNGTETIYKAHEKGALPRDVLKIPALAGGAGMNERWFICHTCDDVFAPRSLKTHADHKIEKHPTQKPLELTRKLIMSSAPKNNGVVLIPFAGSGSECVVTKQLGHNYIGYEINPMYIKLAETWLRNP